MSALTLDSFTRTFFRNALWEIEKSERVGDILDKMFRS